MTDPVKSNPRDAVLEKLVAALEKNDGTWQKTWSVIADNRPHNPISGTNYRGVNLLSLAVNATENNYNDPHWCTYNQAKEAGHPVAAGQKCSAQVLFYKVDTILKNGDKEYTLRGKDLHESAEKLINQMYPNKPCKLNREYSVDKAIGFIENQYPNLSHRTSAVAKLTPVFNFSQMENAPELEVKSTVRTWDNNQDIEQLVQNSGVKVVHDQIDSNFYLPSKNEIHLTPKASFDTPEKYYSTLLHEVSHAKIADGTLEFSTDFSKYHEDKTVRAKEELRAEISSVFLCSELGLNYDVQNHANYLNSWFKNIKEDKQEFWSAVSDSNRIANGVLAYENQIEKEKDLIIPKETLENNQAERYSTREEALESDKHYMANVNGEYITFNNRDELVSVVIEDHNQDYKMDKELSDAYYDGGIEEFAEKLAKREEMDNFEIEEVENIREQEQEHERD